ncbi:MAG TPA: alpha/beta hydrolase [Devosia sp.]|nr:alpha/beta hydrolase [Devosia sp.]
MSVREKSALLTWTTGRPEGRPVILLHDRFGDHEANDGLGAELAASHRVVSVRAARTQMENGFIKGYYWFLGDLQHPELSTFGDGLSHLERLLVSLTGERKAVLAGTGQGGVMALTMAMIWPGRVAGIASIGGPLPADLEGLPVELLPITGLPILLAGPDLADTAAELRQREARLDQRDSATPAEIGDWVRRLP